jgi:glycosyltransferase involved in cell wall biosynthesis
MSISDTFSSTGDDAVPGPYTDDAVTVTCIIIFYNEERFLSDAIESVVKQTFDDWELLLVDDGSTDKSSVIACEYASRDAKRIKYLSHEKHVNAGMSASRNLGLRHARGHFIGFLDGDDVWLEDKLAKQVEIFDRHPGVEMVCGATEHWYSWDSAVGRRDFVRPVGERTPGVVQNCSYPPPALARLLYPLGKGNSPSTSGLIVSRTLVERVGGFEDSFRGLFEDQVFCMKAYLHSSVYISSLCFDRYRQHDHSCCNRASAADQERARLAFLRWMRSHVSAIEFNDQDIRRRLRAALLRAEHPKLWSLANKFLKRVATARSSAA